MLTINELRKLCSTAKMAAIEAGKYIQSQADTQHDLLNKDAGSSLATQVVTEVDLRAQQIILDYLNDSIQEYDLGLLTEESADDKSRANKNYFWCIDPLDGTLPFTERKSGYAVSIALVSKMGNPLVGVVYVPDLEDCYSCVKGDGVLLNDKPFIRDSSLRISSIELYMDRSFETASYSQFVQSHFNELTIKYNVEKIELHTSYGAVRNALAVMMSSKACYFKFPKMQDGGGSIWDFAATMLFFEELKVWVSDAKGGRLKLNNLTTTFMNHSGVLYATDAQLANDIMTIKEIIKV